MEAGIPATDSMQMALIAADTTATSTWLLDRPVPITIVSRLVEIERDTLYLYPDPYAPSAPVAREGSAHNLRVRPCTCRR